MGSIWREPEVHKSVLSYVHTGHVPDDAFWSGVEHRRDVVGPGAFDRLHPNIAGFLRPPEVLGRLPEGPLFDDFRRRFDLNPARFTHYHPFWGRLLAREPHPGTVVPPVLPPPVPGHAVPEPESMILLCVGIVIGFVTAYVYSRNRR